MYLAGVEKAMIVYNQCTIKKTKVDQYNLFPNLNKK